MENVDNLQEAGCLPRSILGGVLPLICLFLGTVSVVSQRSYLPGRSGILELTGAQAQQAGATLIAIAVFFFARYSLARLPVLSTILQVVGLLVIIIAAFALLVNILWL